MSIVKAADAYSNIIAKYGLQHDEPEDRKDCDEMMMKGRLTVFELERGAIACQKERLAKLRLWNQCLQVQKRVRGWNLNVSKAAPECVAFYRASLKV